jgi:uncharacterized membrane protein YdcZ (DUF606 family)
MRETKETEMLFWTLYSYTMGTIVMVLAYVIYRQHQKMLVMTRTIEALKDEQTGLAGNDRHINT